MHWGSNLFVFQKELSDEIDAFKRSVGLDTLGKEDILDNQAQSQAKKRVSKKRWHVMICWILNIWHR